VIEVRFTARSKILVVAARSVPRAYMTNWHPLAVEGVKLLELGEVDKARLLLRQAVGMHPYEAWPYI